ncbi:MAG: DegT/DnrJ/EryC1/StrS family aminotransferase [Gammaproteobacteria bacterium]|nr:DegT/DnrJ/EryC1/StrS family aminotransferase [Gammaproteobacteria bacterium]
MIPHSRPWITDEDVAAVSRRLSSGMIGAGTAVDALERRLAERYDVAAVIVTGSGAQALLLVLETLGLARGAHVVLPTYLCPELLGVVERTGLVPVYTDVGSDYLLDERDPALTGDSVEAIVLPSLFGRRASVPRGLRSGIHVIHDWAQYVPPAGSDPDAGIAIMSFGATKVIAAGEGGAVLVRDAELGRRLHRARSGEGAYGPKLFAFSDLQAALALTQLDRADAMIARRREIAASYAVVVARIGLDVDVVREFDVPFRLPIRIDPTLHSGLTVDTILKRYVDQGIVVRRPVADLLHHVRPAGRAFPVADALFARTFSLPLYPALTPAEQCLVETATIGIFAR